MIIFIEKVMVINGNWNCQEKEKKRNNCAGSVKPRYKEENIAVKMVRPVSTHQVS